ncbi:MAG: ComEC/Rec2 family competence protein [Phascolarctobacterium sp.]|nr:ComEC/Rec2 family competence protein [Phascolarctobacterium sp.]
MSNIKSIVKILILLAVSQGILVCASAEQNTKSEQQIPAGKQINQTADIVPAGKLKITVLDVNHGDAILLQTNKHNYLIDAGHKSSRDAFVSNMEKLGVKRVDTLIITHHHRDHMGNAEYAAGKYGISRIWDNGIVNTEYPKSVKLHEILVKGNYKNKVLQAGDRFDFEKTLHFEVLSPGTFLPEFADDIYHNCTSIVMKMTFGAFSMLFAADVEASAEAAIVKEYGDSLKVDVVKVPHHGAKTSSKLPFVSATSPKYALISCGEPRTDHHPHPKVVSAWENQGAKVYSTLMNGNLTILTDGKDYTVSTEK